MLACTFFADVLGLSPRSSKFLSKRPFFPFFFAVSACENDDSSSALDERKGDWAGRQTMSELSECPAPAGVFSWRTLPSIGRFYAADVYSQRTSFASRR
mmetsp:Transcript_92427/g.149239  ORF Transcript_92427/g.149239 Transcript_92427/m.149239 type:complete len:99 (+) Transcript_92427:254-550(+)